MIYLILGLLGLFLETNKPQLAEGEKSAGKKILRACVSLRAEVLDFLDFLVLLYQDKRTKRKMSEPWFHDFKKKKKPKGKNTIFAARKNSPPKAWNYKNVLKIPQPE